MAEFAFHHDGVSVPNLDEAIDWYGRVLGFELFEVEGAAPLPEDRRYPPANRKTHGNKHVAFRVDNLAAHRHRVKAWPAFQRALAFENAAHERIMANGA